MPADYRKANRTPLIFHSGTNMIPNATRYFTNDLLHAGITLSQVCLGVTGTLRHLYVEGIAAPGAGETVTFTVMLNGAPSALTAQIAGAAQTQDSDLVNEVAVVPTDIITIRCVTSLNAVTTDVRAAVSLFH